MHAIELERKIRPPGIRKGFLEIWRLLKSKRREFDEETIRDRLAFNASRRYDALRAEVIIRLERQRELAIYYPRPAAR